MSEIARQELGLSALANRLADLTSSRAYILDGLARVRSTESGQGAGERLNDLLSSERCLELMRRVGQDHHRRTVVVDNVQLTVSPIVSGPDLLGYVLLEATAPTLRTSTKAWPTWRPLSPRPYLCASARSRKASCGGERTYSATLDEGDVQRARPRSGRCRRGCVSRWAGFRRVGSQPKAEVRGTAPFFTRLPVAEQVLRPPWRRQPSLQFRGKCGAFLVRETARGPVQRPRQSSRRSPLS